MLRKPSVLALLLLLAFSCATAQAPANSPLPPHLFTAFGTFEKVDDGWRCKAIASTPPALVRDLKIGDIVTSIDGVKVAGTNAIAMLRLVRTLEFELARSVEADRAGHPLKWTAPAAPQIVASQ